MGSIPHLARAAPAGRESDWASAQLARVVERARAMHRQRPAWLRRIDARAAGHPDWLLDKHELAAMAYLDRFAGTVVGFSERIGYIRDLGVTYLHLMPLFAVPDGPNDGGYAVAS